MEKVDTQAARTDELYGLVKGPSTRSPNQRPRQHKVVGNHYSESRHGRRHVSGSGYKKRSPKHGRSKRYIDSRAGSRVTNLSSLGYSSSENSDVESQVRQAMGMLELRFAQHRGKSSLHHNRELQAILILR